MQMSPIAKPASRAHGFSLVELMVGMVISMLAIIVVLQVFSVFESRKRQVSNGGDAQTDGALAFQQMQRDIGQAGYGFSSASVFNCSIRWTPASGSALATPLKLAPVAINPGAAIIPAGDANTDTVLLMYGNTDGQPQGNAISAQATGSYTVQMPTAFALKDRVIAAPAACASTLVLDEISAISANSVNVKTGSSGSVLYNLGPAPAILAYAIRGGKLTQCDYMQNDCGLAANKDNPSIWTPIAGNIVSMRAVYWRDTAAAGAMDGIPDANGHDQASPASGCDWARISAIGLALVSRNGEYDKDIVTATARNAPALANAPAWSENAAAPLIGTAGSLGPDQAADEPWKHYRYKVLEAVIPIRNVAWMGAVSGC
jgi:type IV pilus assembly protein PilW